jgi:hypothetical protein
MKRDKGAANTSDWPGALTCAGIASTPLSLMSGAGALEREDARACEGRPDKGICGWPWYAGARDG